MGSAEWGEEDVERVAVALFRCRYHESEMDPWLVLGAELGMGVMEDLARALLASGVVVPARVVEEACSCYPGGFTPDIYEGPQEDCPVHGRPYAYWVEGCADLNDRLRAAEAETARLRGAIEAVCVEMDRFEDGAYWTPPIRAVLAEPVGEGGRS